MTQHRGFTCRQLAQHKGPIHSPDCLVTANILSLHSVRSGLSLGLVGAVHNAMSHDFGSIAHTVAPTVVESEVFEVFACHELFNVWYLKGPSHM